MALKNFHHASISTGDMEKVFAFYRDLLGLEVVFDVDLDSCEPNPENFPNSEMHPTAAWMKRCKARCAFIKLPGDSIYIEVFQYREPVSKPVKGKQLHQYDHRISHIGFQVEDIEALCKKLKEQGVEFHWYPPADVGNGTLAVYVYDFEGNTVELIQQSELSGLAIGKA